MGTLWLYSSLDRVRSCSRYTPPGASGGVAVRRHEEDGNVKVGYAGLVRCGSVWACPLCSTRINATRRLEVGALVVIAQSRGYYFALQTVTLRHWNGQSLGMLFDALSNGQRSVTNATAVRRVRKELGLVGYVRALEITYGANGWHPHIHKLLIFDHKPTAEDLRCLQDAEYPVWVRQCAKRGLGTPIKECYDIRPVYDVDEAAQYIVKSDDVLSVAFSQKLAEHVKQQRAQAVADGKAVSISGMAHEMVGGMWSKSGRAISSMTTWQLLEAFQATGDMRYLDLWLEFERASKGRRQNVWSRGLKKMFGIGEISDDEIAEREEGTRDDTLFWVSDWSVVARHPELAAGLLEAVYRKGLSGGLQYCQEHGIPTYCER